MQGLRRAGLVVACVATLLASGPSGCFVQGQSSREMKQDMLDSFLFKSADIFYPNGLPENPEELPALPPKKVAEVRRMYDETVAGVRKQHAQHANALSRVFERPIAYTLKTKVIVTDTGQPVARVESNGDISIDLKVAQALYRGALLSGLEDKTLGGPRFMDERKAKSSERETLKEFFDAKKKIEEAPASTIFGDLAGAVSSAGTADWEKKGWFLMADYRMKSAAIERHYIGQMRFLMAHELGHGALGHPARLREIKPGDCEALHDLELEADAYATLLFALSTPELAVFDGGGFGPDMFGIRTIAGFDDFFQYTYDLSGFSAVASSSACGYPDPAVRAKQLSDIYSAVRKAQAEAQLLEIERRQSAGKSGAASDSTPK